MPIYAVEDVPIDSATAAFFSSIAHFIDPKELTFTYGAQSERRVTAKAFLVHRFGTQSGQGISWLPLSADYQPEAQLYATYCQLYCVIRAGDKYHLLATDPSTIQNPPIVTIGGQQRTLTAWPTAYPTPQFHWLSNSPVFKGYNNDGPTSWRYDKLAYDASEISTIPWVINLWTPQDSLRVGVSWWSVAVDIGSTNRKLETWNIGDRNDRPGDQSIHDNVKRLRRMGNYHAAAPEYKGFDYLRWASTFINTATVFGSHVNQVNKYHGTDCADLLMGAYRKWAEHQSPPQSALGDISAQTIYSQAKSGTSDHFRLIFDRKQLSEITLANLRQGDLLVLAESATAINGHAIIYIQSGTTGTLSLSNLTLQANFNRIGTPWENTNQRVGIVPLQAVMPPYTHVSVVRLKKLE
jgi:hypothetical protein